jgi:hypothetical protein
MAGFIDAHPLFDRPQTSKRLRISIPRPPALGNARPVWDKSSDVRETTDQPDNAEFTVGCDRPADC